MATSVAIAGLKIEMSLNPLFNQDIVLQDFLIQEKQCDMKLVTKVFKISKFSN